MGGSFGGTDRRVEQPERGTTVPMGAQHARRTIVHAD
jgi:hypothetical protein